MPATPGWCGSGIESLLVGQRVRAEMPTRVDGMALWNQRLAQLRSAFTTTGWSIFQVLMIGWILCPGRKTIIGIYRMADPLGTRAHDAFHRFVRCGAWKIDE